MANKHEFTEHTLDHIQDGATALYVAAQNGHLKVVEILIAAKCQVDIQDKVSLRACTSQHVHGSFKLPDHPYCVYRVNSLQFEDSTASDYSYSKANFVRNTTNMGIQIQYYPYTI